MDVHAETIAVAEPNGEVRSLGTFANRAESIRRLVKKLGSVEQLRACYGRFQPTTSFTRS
jgi:transposase